MSWFALTLATIAGYLIGSVSPAFILGHLVGHVDIRTVNYKNAGTRNVKRSIGLWPAVVTAIIDTGKGIAALVLARELGVAGFGLLLPTAATVAGHIFPFYLGFRGGRGTATAIGVFLYLAADGIYQGTVRWEIIVALLVAAGLIYAVTRSGDATALFAFLGMVLVSVFEFEMETGGALGLLMSGYVLLHAVFRGRDVGLYELPDRGDVPGWRVVLRPLALLFIPLNLVLPRPWFIGLLSLLAGAALFLDGYRMVSRRRMRGIYREKEERRLSSISLFLVSVLLIFVLFQPSIAFLALGFLTIGDLAGKLVGMRFGRTKLIAGRTLEGSTGFFVGALLAGYAVATAAGGPGLLIVLAGAGSAALIELLTLGLDDNLTVGLGAAGVISLLTLL